MTSGSLTRMLHNSKHKLSAGGQRAASVASWCVSLLFAGLLLTLGSCTTPGDIGVGLPDANANTGAYLVDTLTIKASTVLRDSVVTSASTNLIVGQYNDPELGRITAKSYFSLTGTFQPDQTQVFDSAVLVLKPTIYRYGDTTKTQALVEVHALTSPISDTKYSFASPKLTPVPYNPSASPILNQSRQDTSQLVAPVLRARPNLTTLRLRLSNKWGRGLFKAAKDGKIATQDQLDANYFGLALVPGATDNAAIIAFSTNTAGGAVTLYYHDPTTPGTAVSQDFTLNGRHFYQVTADRTSAASPALASLTNSLQSLPAAQTAQRTYIQGALGLVTKLEFPYLANVSYFSDHLIVTNATITAPVATGTATGLLPPPLPASATVPPLLVYYTDQSSRLIAPYSDSDGGVSYSNATNFSTGLEQQAYSWSVKQYCQSVINRSIPNNGLIIAPYAPEFPTRVVLNGPLSATNKLQLRLYFIGNR
jgi:hypothetical protein